jgi:hypothetical protein
MQEGCLSVGGSMSYARIGNEDYRILVDEDR